MDITNSKEKPSLVSAGQGFSFLNTVSYKGRFLYSKYNPRKAVEAQIDSLEFLKGTLVLVFSPVLWYGLDRLMEKLPEDCVVFAFEQDQELYKLALEQLCNFPWKNKNVFLFNLNDTKKIENSIKNLLSSGKIKRSLRIDFSAGVQFYKDIYDYNAKAVQDIIGTFWKNRITLSRMGRLFSKNLFKNISLLDSSLFLDDVEKSVEKPILVLGAGEGLDTIQWNGKKRSSIYILAVDAAFIPLLHRGIIPDAIVGMESQAAIQKAYIGIKGTVEKTSITFFADLSSRHEILRDNCFSNVFFASRYADGIFFDRLMEQGLVKSYINPMGSVGLAAFYIATRLRKNKDVKIYTAGLDFSYSIGSTHAKGTMAHNARLASCTRIIPVENYEAAFCPGSEKIMGKNGQSFVTTKNLFSYGCQFRTFFGNTENAFDVSQTGMDIGLEQGIFKYPESNKISTESSEHKEIQVKTENKNRAAEFIRKEKEQLEIIKQLMMFGEKSQFYDGTDLKLQLKKLLECREYLYLHFPDGYKLSMDTPFLKRIRAEIDFFLKCIS